MDDELKVHLDKLREETKQRFTALFEPEQQSVIEMALLSGMPDFDSLAEDALKAMNEAMDTVRVRVDAPEKWPEAKDINFRWTFKALQGLLAFDLRAISRMEEDEILKMVPRGKDAIERQNAMAMFVILTIERGWGKTFPGETPAAKVAWIEEQLTGQMGVYQEMNAAIQALSGYATLDQWLIPRDKSGRNAAALDRSVEAMTETVEIDDPAAWAKIAMGEQFYRIHRAGITYEWPVQPVPVKRDREISKLTEDPDAPMVVQHAPGTGRPCGSKPNPDDPAYLATLTRNAHLRQMLHIEAALPFELPGTNDEEKCAWLAQRPAGDVDALYKFVTRDIHNLSLATDFF